MCETRKRRLCGFAPVLVALLITFVPDVQAEPWSIGFYTPWGHPVLPVSDIQWNGLTHVAMYAVVPNADGSLEFTFGDMATKAPELIAAAHANNAKVLLSVWQNGPGNYPSAVKDHRATLVGNIMNVVDTYGFDGVDIDWESNFDQSLCKGFLIDLRSKLGTKPINICVNTAPANSDSLYPYVDRISAMTYDLNGTWNPYSWYNSALYSPPPGNQVWSTHLTRQRFEAAGVPLSKFCTGFAFYGNTITGVAAPRVTGATYTVSQISYNTIATSYDTTKAHWDDEAKVPWLPIDGGYITYDNERSIKEKVNYIQQNGLGGWIIWALDSDYLPDNSVKNPLLNAIAEAMGTTSTTNRSIADNFQATFDISTNSRNRSMFSVKYTLPGNADVKLEVYNAAGVRVQTIHEGLVSAGSHTETFTLSGIDGYALSSTVYFLRFSAGSRVGVKKLVHLQ